MNTVYLDPAMVPANLRGNYTGKTFRAIVAESVTIPITAGLWDGGSRETYSLIDLATGNQIPFPNQDSAPWSNERGDTKVTLSPGYAVVRHSTFQGKDMGLTFYVHPTNATALLPRNDAELSIYDKLTLYAARSFKSSYAGQDRFDMLHRECEFKQENPAKDFKRSYWTATKESLANRGLLDKRGAITNAGRNAIGNWRP